LDELLVAARLTRAFMNDAGETPLARSTDGHALERTRPMAGREGHLAPRENKLHGPADLMRRDRRERDVRPRAQAGAEGAADEGTDNLHILLRQAEDRRDLGLLIGDELALAPKGQAIAIPRGNGGMGLHGVM